MAASNTKTPVILAMEPDHATQKVLARAFNSSGAFLLRYAGDPKKTGDALRLFRPELLLVHSELGSPAMEDVFRALFSEPELASLPVVVLCREDVGRELLRHFRSGIVHQLVEPFQPDLHVPEMAEMLRSLPARAGVVRGRGEPGEIAALVAHVQRTRRSGALALDPSRPEEGSALFIKGGLHSAQRGLVTGDAALEALIAAPPSRWAFRELSGQPGEGAGVVIEVGARAEGEAGVDLEVEAAVARKRPSGEVRRLGAPPVEEEAPAWGPIKVLLVDDDPELCRMFSLTLKRRGFEVTTAPDGVEGYDQASRGAYDVVVADLAMPRMDGWGLLRQIRDDYRTRELPVAFLSCHDDYRDSLRALDAGAQAYLSKSVKHDVLAQQIRTLLAPRQQVLAEMARKGRVTVQLDPVGPQWLVRELGRRRATGRLEVKDDWATYRLDLRDGEVVSARAEAGQYPVEGERAFIALLGSRSAAGTFDFGPPAGAAGQLGALEALLDRAVQALNEKDRRAREALLVRARKIQVDRALYDLYTQVGPAQWLPTAKLICEDRLPPAEVIARDDTSPLDVEETLKDLVRRGVVTLEV